MALAGLVVTVHVPHIFVPCLLIQGRPRPPCVLPYILRNICSSRRVILGFLPFEWPFLKMYLIHTVQTMGVSSEAYPSYIQ